MNKSMKRSTFVLCAAMAGLFAVYTPSSWSDEKQQQTPPPAANAQGPQGKQGQGMNHDGMGHDSMKGMDHGSMKGMDHDSMKGMDHDKMMESHGRDKDKASKNGQ